MAVCRNGRGWDGKVRKREREKKAKAKKKSRERMGKKEGAE